jgi:ATP-dependent helicase/nuclease subunit A
VTTSEARDAYRRADAETRRRAQREFEVPLLIEAGAGTGKTTVLVARVVAWCLGRGWERHAQALGERGNAAAGAAEIAPRALARVVAITFTEAAAAEMSRRVASAFAALARGEALQGVDPDALPAAGARAERASALLAAVDQLRVQTIHSFCLGILRSEPFAAGVHPRLAVDADGRQRQAALREVLGEALASAEGELAGPLLALAARGFGPAEIAKELAGLLAAGVESRQLDADPLAPERVRPLLARFAEALARLALALREARAGVTPVSARAIAALEATREWLAQTPEPSLSALVAALDSQWGESKIERVGEWSQSDLTKGDAKAFGDAVPRIAEASAELAPLLAKIRALDPELLAVARPVLRELLVRVESWLALRGAISFDALLAAAARAVGDPGVRARVRRGIDQLLVDEFQDTDRLQCELVRALALDDDGGARPGLFLVGDPKQSIYGWRNADLAAYDAFKDELLAAGGRCDPLVVNYRSVPAILDEVERALAPVLVPVHGLQPAFQPLVASDARSGEPGFAQGRFAPVEHWWPLRAGPDGSRPEKLRVDDVARIEAAELAAELRELHDAAGVPWGRIAVLFRTRTDWETVLRALRERGVPYAVEGDRNYYRRREIIDASALVRAVLDPGDAIALVGFLRSACVGVPDAALDPLFERGLAARLARVESGGDAALSELAELARGVARELSPAIPGIARVAGWEESLIDAARRLASLRQCYAEAPGDAFVEALRRETLFEASESARHLGAWRSEHLEPFFREVAERLGAAEGLAGLLRELRKRVDDEEELRDSRAPEPAADAVRISTIHKAKGLDFDHVYAVQLYRGAGNSRGVRAGRLRGDAAAFEYHLFGAPTLDYDVLLCETREREDAENARALYVALTRARDRLVVSALPREWLLHGSSRALSELLAQRREGAAPAIEELTALPREGGRAWLDRDGARWSLVEHADGTAAPAETGSARAAAGEPQAGAGQTRADARSGADGARLWAERRARARARMRRPLAGRASAGDARAWREARGDADERAPTASASGAGGAPDLAREAAQQVGSAIHRSLESLDLARADRALAEALLAGFGEALAALGSELSAERATALRGAGEALVQRIASGPFLSRLRALAPHLVARELPVLLPATPASGALLAGEPVSTPASAPEPLAYVAGAVDLVYRDPESGEWVVADYKTDQLPGAPSAAAVREHAERYRAQLERYGRAVAEAVGCGRPPRLELWFLAHGERVVLRPAAPAAGHPTT